LDLPTLLFRVTLVTFATVVPFVAGVYSAIDRNSGYRFVKRLDADVRGARTGVGETTEARLYPRDYFSVSDRTCETGTYP
jgi:hypothetical protein